MPTYKEQRWKLLMAYFTGDDELKAGYGLCFDSDYGTASEVEGERAYRVEQASQDNNLNFAGVVHPSCHGKTGPCEVMLIVPEDGIPLPVWTDQDCTILETLLTLQVGTYKFVAGGLRGRGTVKALQTVDRSGAGNEGVVLALPDTGMESGLVESITPPDDDAFDMMPGGVTRLQAADLGNGDATATVEDGTFPGMRKLIECEGTMDTNDVIVSVSHHETSDPEQLFFDADGEDALLRWAQSEWLTEELSAGTS